MTRPFIRARAAARALATETRGVALLEFAFSVPILILLFVGGFQLSDALFAYRKVTMATRTISDLASQYTVVRDADLDTILNASAQVLAPYKASAATMTVMQLKIDAAGTAKVDWSRGKNMTPVAKGTTFVLPAGIAQPNTSLIVAQMTYSYTPVMASAMLGTIPLKEQMIMSPRVTSNVSYTS